MSDKRSGLTYLRIAVSAFFGVLTLLLVVLWVRSAWRADWVWGEIYPSTYWQVGSQHGNLWAIHEYRPGVLKNYKQNNSRPYFWSVMSRPMDYDLQWGVETKRNKKGSETKRGRNDYLIIRLFNNSF